MSTNLHTPWELQFGRDGTEDFGVIFDAGGHELVKSRCFWLPETKDDDMRGTLAGLLLMNAAPKLLSAVQFLLADQNSTVDCEARLILQQAVAEATVWTEYATLPEGVTYEEWPPDPWVKWDGK